MENKEMVYAGSLTEETREMEKLNEEKSNDLTYSFTKGCGNYLTIFCC